MEITELKRRDEARKLSYANYVKEDICLRAMEAAIYPECTSDPQYDGVLVGMPFSVPRSIASNNEPWETTLDQWKADQLEQTLTETTKAFPGLNINCEIKPWKYDAGIMSWAFGERESVNSKSVRCADRVYAAQQMQDMNSFDQEELIAWKLGAIYPSSFILDALNSFIQKDTWQARIVNSVRAQPVTVTHCRDERTGIVKKLPIENISFTGRNLKSTEDVELNDVVRDNELTEPQNKFEEHLPWNDEKSPMKEETPRKKKPVVSSSCSENEEDADAQLTDYMQTAFVSKVDEEESLTDYMQTAFVSQVLDEEEFMRSDNSTDVQSNESTTDEELDPKIDEFMDWQATQGGSKFW